MAWLDRAGPSAMLYSPTTTTPSGEYPSPTSRASSSASASRPSSPDSRGRSILHKRENFREAFAHFDPEIVASFTRDDVQRLLNDEGIIRNRAKILATVNNARATLKLRQHGGLAQLIWSFQPDETPAPTTLAEIPTQSDTSKALAKSLKSHGFKSVGPTTAYALMEAVGLVDTHLVDSHRRGVSGFWNNDNERIIVPVVEKAKPSVHIPTHSYQPTLE